MRCSLFNVYSARARNSRGPHTESETVNCIDGMMISNHPSSIMNGSSSLEDGAFRLLELIHAALYR